MSEGLALAFKRGFEEGFKLGLEEGRLFEARDTVLRQGQIRFGPHDHTIRSKIESITDLKPLRQLLDKLLIATGWHDLLSEL